MSEPSANQVAEKHNIKVTVENQLNDPEDFVLTDELKATREEENKKLTALVVHRINFLEEMYQLLCSRLDSKVVSYVHLENAIRELLTKIDISVSDPVKPDDTKLPTVEEADDTHEDNIEDECADECEDEGEANSDSSVVELPVSESSD
jgi:hypothetical protein